MKAMGLIVADGTRARFLSVRYEENDEFEVVATFQEHEALTNPEGHVAGQSLFSNAKSGRNRAHGGGPAHGYDDHRDQHQRETQRRFAQQIGLQAKSFGEQLELASWLLIAEPRMLGLLRQELEPRLPAGVPVSELAEDLTKRDLNHLRRVLEQNGVVKRPAIVKRVYHPRGQAP